MIYVRKVGERVMIWCSNLYVQFDIFKFIYFVLARSFDLNKAELMLREVCEFFVLFVLLTHSFHHCLHDFEVFRNLEDGIKSPFWFFLIFFVQAIFLYRTSEFNE